MAAGTDQRDHPGLLLVISGPSGVGKTTIVGRLVQRLDAVFSVSATTRPPARGEIDGRDYFFISQQQFDAMIARGEFLEYARVYGKHCYGTPRAAVEEHLRAGRLVILDIDVQGALQVKQHMPEALMLFITPPSDAELLTRLRNRAREDEAVIQRRFAEAKREIETAMASGAYDATIVNRDLDEAVEAACAVVARRWPARC